MPGPKSRPAAERFALYVEKTDGCWNWTGAKQAGGYGRFLADGKVTLVHRWSYMHHVGPIPEGMTIDHLCRNTSCVRPDHLEVVTREENAYRGNRNKDKTHCSAGHELTAENVYVAPGRPKVRNCRPCRAIASAARYAATKNPTRDAADTGGSPRVSHAAFLSGGDREGGARSPAALPVLGGAA